MTKNMLGKRAVTASAAVLLMGLSATANAASLSAFNTDDAISLGVIGSPVATLSDSFSGSVGTLDSTVYLNDDGVYTYAFELTAGINAISELNTSFALFGLISDGTEVGFSFSSTAAAGGAGDASDVSIFLDPDGTLDYEINGSWFGAGDSILFHFRSLSAPVLGDYNAINGNVGSAKGFATNIPLPGAVWMMLSALGGLGFLRRRR